MMTPYSPPPKQGQQTPIAVGENGMAGSAQPLAAATALSTMKEGGNAFDAAIAAVLVEDVTLPAMTSLGGDIFAVVYEAKSDKVWAINGSGRSPLRADIDFFNAKGYKEYLPLDGPLSLAVPGEVDALRTLHENFGSQPIEQLMKPAIEYAEHGFPVNERLHWRIQRVHDKLQECPAAASVFLPNGQAPGIGEKLYQPQLASILKTLRSNGLQDFYHGEVAERLATEIQKDQGLLSVEDLAAHKTHMYAPIATDYRGYRIYETAPPSHGLIVLQSLNILEGYDMASYGMDSPEHIHLMVEAKKLAYHDRLKYCGDPDFVSFDLDRLLSKEHAAMHRKSIQMDRVLNHQKGLLEMLDGDTTYMSVADREGNIVSLIHSISGVEFGSGYVAGDTGIVMNSRLGRGFSMRPDHPNVLQPGKRTMHTLNAYMVFDKNKPLLAGGTPGGDQQAQWNFQVLSLLLDFELNVQEAVEHPRWFSFPSTDEIHLDNPYELRIENRFDPDVYKALEAKGHQLKLIGPWGNGGAQLIQRNKHGVYLGGSDPRIGGIMIGY